MTLRMKKRSLHIASLSIFILISFFSFTNSSQEAQAQATLNINTTQYTVLSSNVFILGGSFSGNVEKKPITTFFQYKRGDDKFDDDGEATVPIVRGSADVSGEFYSSPELRLDTVYYFRAGGYYNDNKEERFYGDTYSFRTGFPYPASFPFVYEYNGQGGGMAMPYVALRCEDEDKIYSPYVDECIDRLTCQSPQVYSPRTDECEMPISCKVGDIYSPLVNDCVPLVGCKDAQVYSPMALGCVTPIICQPPKTYSSAIDNCVSTTKCVSPYPIYDSNKDICISSSGCAIGTAYNPATDKCVPAPTSTSFNPQQAPGIAPTTQTTSSSSTSTPEPYSQDGLVPCTGNVGDNCDFYAFMKLINNVMDFIIKGLLLPIAAIMFAYAGLRMMTAGGEAAGARGEAKNIFMNTIIGIILVLGAVLIVKTVLTIIGYDSAWILS